MESRCWLQCVDEAADPRPTILVVEVSTCGIFQTTIPFWVLSTTVVLTASAGARGDVPTGAELGRVDFRYAPPWWQSAICLPDDPDKILVGKEGQVLLEFGQGGVRNFGIVLQPEIDSGTTWVKQQTISPRAPIVQTFQEAGGVELLAEAFVVIPPSESPAARPKIVRVDGCPARTAGRCSGHPAQRHDRRSQAPTRLADLERQAGSVGSG